MRRRRLQLNMIWPTPNSRKVTILLEEAGLDDRLHDRQYIAGGEYSIAEMICYPWTAAWENHPLELSEFRNLSRWFEELSAREAVQRGMAVGSDMAIKLEDYTPEEIESIRKLIFNQRAIPLPV